MELITTFFDLLLHLDRHLALLIQNYGLWVYAILFLIVFCETGLVVTPFLPGDSLLFVAGTLAAAGGMDAGILFGLLTVAAILGDTVNYWVGAIVGPKVFREGARYLKKEHLDRTHGFYERHGGKTVIIARFLPIIRTFAPFVAGIGRMDYGRFLFFNVTGGVLWVGFFVFAGYFFGNLPIVKQNLTLVIGLIIILSIMPGLVEYWRHRSRSSN